MLVVGCRGAHLPSDGRINYLLGGSVRRHWTLVGAVAEELDYRGEVSSPSLLHHSVGLDADTHTRRSTSCGG